MEDFRRLRPDEMASGHAVLIDAFNWVRMKGLEQWSQPFPLDLYKMWQETGSNYGLFQNDVLAAVVTFRRQELSHWAHVVGKREFLWVLALATATAFKGKALGKEAMRQAIQWIIQEKPQDIYLDCEKGDGFLQEFYSDIGFELLAEQTGDFGDLGTLNLVLMKYPKGL